MTRTASQHIVFTFRLKLKFGELYFWQWYKLLFICSKYSKSYFWLSLPLSCYKLSCIVSYTTYHWCFLAPRHTSHYKVFVNNVNKLKFKQYFIRINIIKMIIFLLLIVYFQTDNIFNYQNVDLTLTSNFTRILFSCLFTVINVFLPNLTKKNSFYPILTVLSLVEIDINDQVVHFDSDLTSSAKITKCKDQLPCNCRFPVLKPFCLICFICSFD